MIKSFRFNLTADPKTGFLFTLILSNSIFLALFVLLVLI